MASSPAWEKPLTKIQVDGATISDFLYEHITLARVEREFRLPSRVTLKFEYPNLLPSDATESDFAPKINSEIKVIVSGTTLAVAEVTSLEIESDIHGRRVTVTALDRAHRLGNSREQSNYPAGNVSSIVSSIANRNGLTASVEGAPASTISWLMQVESDLDMLTSLAERTGCDWWVDDRTLNFKKPVAAAKTTFVMGVALLSWRLRVREPVVNSVTVQGRQPTKRTLVKAVANSTPDATIAPVSDLSSHKTGTTAGKALITQLSLNSADEASLYANAVLDRAAAAASNGSGQVYFTPTLLPGADITISGSGLGNGDFSVRSVEHQLRAGDWETFFTTGERAPLGLTDLVSSGGTQESPSWRQEGLVVGIVTNNKDPDNMGRVKVGFSTLAADAGQAESDWARIVSLGGGNNRGSVSLPEVEDEVLVGFENGNVQHPVVIGGLFGDKATIPTAAPVNGKVPSRRITSRLGHVFEMGDGDQPADQYMSMAVNNGAVFKLDTTSAGITVKDDGDNITLTCGQASITMKATGEISVKGTKISMEGQQEVDLKGLKVQIAADTELAMSGTAKAGLKGAMIEITGDATAKVAAPIVEFN